MLLLLEHELDRHIDLAAHALARGGGGLESPMGDRAQRGLIEQREAGGRGEGGGGDAAVGLDGEAEADGA